MLQEIKEKYVPMEREQWTSAKERSTMLCQNFINHNELTYFTKQEQMKCLCTLSNNPDIWSPLCIADDLFPIPKTITK